MKCVKVDTVDNNSSVSLLEKEKNGQLPKPKMKVDDLGQQKVRVFKVRSKHLMNPP